MIALIWAGTILALAAGAIVSARFRQQAKRSSIMHHPPGSGLTYCSGFQLDLSGASVGVPNRSGQDPVELIFEIVQIRTAGNDLAVPRTLERKTVTARQVHHGLDQFSPARLAIETDSGGLGHPCNEIFLIRISHLDRIVEIQITETQTTCEAAILQGDGWLRTQSSKFPAVEGPPGVRIEYRPWHSYRD